MLRDDAVVLLARGEHDVQDVGGPRAVADGSGARQTQGLPTASSSQGRGGTQSQKGEYRESNRELLHREVPFSFRPKLRTMSRTCRSLTPRSPVPGTGRPSGY